MSADRREHKTPTRRPVHFRIPMRYRLIFINENKLTEVWSIRMSLKRIIFALAAIIVALLCVGAIIMSLTPLRTLLPGYLKGAERREYLAANARIDSLIDVVAINDLYLNSLNAILLGEVNPDSLLKVPVDPQPLDTALLLRRSEAEAEFVARYSSSSPFSIDSLPALVPGAPAFVAPVRNAVVTPGSSPATLRFIFNDTKNPVYAIAKGVVIDVSGGSDEGFTVVCQHPEGFLTRYSGLSKVNCRRGQKIQSGSQLGQYLINQDYGFGFDLVRDSQFLNPLEYIIF